MKYGSFDSHFRCSECWIENLDLGEVEESAEEVGVLEKTCSSLHGICGILDCGSSKAANLFITSAKSIGYGFMFIRLSKNFFYEFTKETMIPNFVF